MEYCGKSETAKEETNEKVATEIMNLKITNAQIKSYSETQEMPSLQYLADRLCEDNEMEYVELTTKKKSQASTDKTFLPLITVKEGSSIFTKLKEYPYEFEIDWNLKLASVNGVKIANSDNSKEVEELKTTVENLENTITTLQTKIEKLEQNKDKTIDYSSTLNQEKLIGKWYDGSDMYELSLPITVPTATTDGTNVWNKIDLQKYNIKECCVVAGYYDYDKEKAFFPLPIWTAGDNKFVRIGYFSEDNTLRISNSFVSHNGGHGFVTIHYNKKN